MSNFTPTNKNIPPSPEEVRQLLLTSKTVSGMLHELRGKLTERQYFVFIREHGLEELHYELRMKGLKKKSRRTSNEELFVKGVENRNSLIRLRLLKDNLLPYVCSECGQEPFWNGKPLVIQVDHIDGDSTNNELTNLRFLCGHCHSQTDTFGQKNRRVYPSRRQQRVCHRCGIEIFSIKARFCDECRGYAAHPIPCTKEELQVLLDQMPLKNIAKIYNVTPTTVSARAKKLGCSLKPHGYWVTKERMRNYDES